MRIPILTVALVLMGVPGSAQAWQPVARSSAAQAASFIAELARKSPQHDGVPLRRYHVQDLDGDGVAEVLEYVSAYEKAAGLLNVELAPAFEWVNVYRYRDGRYGEDAASFGDFLAARRSLYEFWLRVLEHPAVLDKDSQEVVKANRREFRDTLRGFISRVTGFAR